MYRKLLILFVKPQNYLVKMAKIEDDVIDAKSLNIYISLELIMFKYTIFTFSFIIK